MEMLVHSEPGLLHLLPALPAEHLPKGRIEGVLARGAVTIESLAWDMGAAELTVSMRSAAAQTVALLGPRRILSLSSPNGEPAGEPPSDGQEPWRVPLPAGRTVELRASLEATA